MSSSGDKNVEIKITGSVDPSLKASTAAAAAEMDKTAVSAKAMSDALKATGGDVSKITPEMLGLSNNLEKVTTSAKATSTAMGSVSWTGLRDGINASVGLDREIKSASASASVFAKSLGATATIGPTVAGALGQAENATSKFAGMTVRARTEVIVLAHEMVQGRFARIPGSMMVLAEAMGGVSLATWGMIAGVAAAGIGAGVLVYRAYEAEKELYKLAEGFKLTGRGAEESSALIAYELGFLEAMPGVSKKVANSFMELAAEHANWDYSLRSNVEQLMPAFVTIYGDKAPQAAGKLMESLSDLTLSGFQKLDKELLNLNPVQYQHIEQLIQTGQEAQAVSEIMKALSTNSGIYIKSLGDQVYDVQQKIKQTEEAMRGLDLSAPGAAGFRENYIAQLDELQNKLKAIRAEEATQGQQGKDNQYKRDIDDAVKIAESLDHEGEQRKKLAKLKSDLAAAEQRHDTVGDNSGAAKSQRAITLLQAQIDKEDEAKRKQAERQGTSAQNKAYGDYSADERAKVAATAAGTAERLAIEQQWLEHAKAIYGEGSRQYADVVREINTTERTAHTQRNEIARSGANADLEIGRYSIQQKRNDLDAEVAAGKITNQQKLAQLAQFLKDEEKLEQGVKNTEISGLDPKSDLVAIAQANDQKRVLAKKLEVDLADINKEIARDNLKTNNQITKGWEFANRSILSAEQTFVQGFLSGRQTMGQLALNTTARFLEQEITSDIAYWTERGLLSLEGVSAEKMREQGGLIVALTAETTKTAATQAGSAARAAAGTAEHAGFLSRIATEVAGWLGFETGKTAETTAGAATRASAAVAETTTGIAAAKASALAEIPAYTQIAAMGAASAVAPIPIVGPALATAAYGEMQALGTASLAMASFDVGTNYVPHDMVAQIHQGERIIPAADNRALMAATGSGNSTTNNQGGDQHFHANFSPTVNGKGSSSMDDLRSQQSEFVSWVHGMVRTGALKLA